uniref:Uncharacterized protein n=1 Tax=Candidatus Kentrum sp. TUN TaxID=2126343 RepID=A0A450ZM88_9GAMM|nr:MAG: hypothetical protein BECKTUN1418D_GA0071000_10255 [Candidatus Kentron sp. TUN]VFK55882.1 MAG: hypothetical protein BECKTUN1418F_GA0071002_107610 [Candidatus Kentron sp. TUN]VFK61914.1 MAG: hypothetical protein BECKTUN1418E_GA0071001_107310 [Candidatus Kentron sp. TUN]
MARWGGGTGPAPRFTRSRSPQPETGQIGYDDPLRVRGSMHISEQIDHPTKTAFLAAESAEIRGKESSVRVDSGKPGDANPNNLPETFFLFSALAQSSRMFSTITEELHSRG